MRQAGRLAYRYLVALFFAGVIVQFFLAGLGVFRTQHDADGGVTISDHRFEHNFSPHAAWGFMLSILGLLVFLSALGGRLGRSRVLLSLALPVLVELQGVLANAGPSGFRALHPVNACLILGVSAYLAHRAWRTSEAAAPESAPAAAQ
jgi:Family of unknown function (DUF6220)